jgi:hypothetical protein
MVEHLAYNEDVSGSSPLLLNNLNCHKIVEIVKYIEEKIAQWLEY